MKYVDIFFPNIGMRFGGMPVHTKYSQQTRSGRLSMHKGFWYLVLAVLIVVCAGCAGLPPSQQEQSFEPDTHSIVWRMLCPGVEAADIYNSRLPLIAHAVKIDLHHPAIRIVTTEAARFYDTQGCVIGETTQEFAERLHTVAACNAAPFHAESLLFSRYRRVIGVHITEYSCMSTPNPRYGALLFSADKTARIIETQTEAAFSEEVCSALGGFWMILKDGRVLPQKLERRDSRTAVGLTADGATLFMLAVEGEWKGCSQGLSYTESAVLLRGLGASDALQFDGGSSSSLVLKEGAEQRLISPSRGWNIHIPVASNLGIVYTE